MAEDTPAKARAASPVFFEISGHEWEHRAVQLGKVAGKAVAVLRKARRQWDESGIHGQDPTARVRSVAETLRRETAARTEEWRQAAKERSVELRRQAKAGLERTRARAEKVGRDYPMQLVLASAIAGLVLGIGLRVWRSQRAA